MKPYTCVPSYKNLPPLAGVATMDEAMKPGLSVEESVARLKRHHYSFKRLHQIFTASITAEPVYELKMAFSLHAWLCAEHVTAMRTRVAEMREPPLGLDAVPDSNLEIFFDEILAAPTTQELIVGLYEIALPAFDRALSEHAAATNPLADHPTVRACKIARMEVGEMLEFGRGAIGSLLDADTRQGMSEWLDVLRDAIAKPQAAARRHYSVKPYVYDGTPQRDERFIDPYNRGVNPEGLLYSESMPVKAKTLMMYYKRLREIDVPEMMASIITETPGKPWEYYRQMSRQLWDEARHAMMGEVGFNSVGVDWSTVPISWTWSLGLNTQLAPRDRHAVLYFIEQSLMPKTGKRYEWEVGVQSNDPLAKLFQDYDWADEVLHAAIGREWYVSEFTTAREAVAYADRVWTNFCNDPQHARFEQLTDNRNWWPDVYVQACRHWDIDPDPAVLAYNAAYDKQAAASA